MSNHPKPRQGPDQHHPGEPSTRHLIDRFEAITRIVRQVLKTKWAYITLTPEAALSLPTRDGITLVLKRNQGAPCWHVVETGEPLMISDATIHPITRNLPPQPSVPRLGYYVACPLRDSGSRIFGALCAIDPEPRAAKDQDLQNLIDLASWVETEVRLTENNLDTDTLLDQLAAARRVATIDTLTGLWNRQAIFDVAQRELERCRRCDERFALAMLDIDHFKHFNDTLGHQAGDQVLVAISTRLVDSIRSYDAVGRYGGEEFVVLLVGCDNSSAATAAEKIRLAIKDRPMATFRGEVTATASLGVAVFGGSRDERDLLQLLSDADDALLTAKRSGRDRVVMAGIQRAAERGRIVLSADTPPWDR